MSALSYFAVLRPGLHPRMGRGGAGSQPSWGQRLAALVCVLLGLVLHAGGARALEVPPLEGRINDRAGVLSAQAEQRLSAQLEAYERATGHQMAVLIVPSLEGDPIEDFTIRVVEAWKLGRQGKDDGILLFMAVDDRKMRIEVGYGLEGDLPDILVGRIMREVMAPAFRQGELAAGISRAISAMAAVTGGEGEPLPAPRRTRGHGGGVPPYLLLLVVLFLFLGGGRGAGAFMLGSVLGGFGRGGFGGGSRQSGGFRGGGGGFGGGGASGSW